LSFRLDSVISRSRSSRALTRVRRRYSYLRGRAHRLEHLRGDRLARRQQPGEPAAPLHGRPAEEALDGLVAELPLQVEQRVRGRRAARRPGGAQRNTIRDGAAPSRPAPPPAGPWHKVC
jgi:hypothetical protein